MKVYYYYWCYKFSKIFDMRWSWSGKCALVECWHKNLKQDQNDELIKRNKKYILKFRIDVINHCNPRNSFTAKQKQSNKNSVNFFLNIVNLADNKNLFWLILHYLFKIIIFHVNQSRMINTLFRNKQSIWNFIDD